MKQFIISFSLLFVFMFSLSAQCSFEKQLFLSSKGDTLPYRLLKPEGMKKGQKYPLVLFLHGAGERGNDNEKQLINGSQMFLNPVNLEKYPAFVLMPQCPETAYWDYDTRPKSFVPFDMPVDQPLSSMLGLVKEMLDSYLAMPQVDKSRVYVMGLSMGGMATYNMTIRFPEIFAAAVPICGSVYPERLKNVKGVAFYIFHGDADEVVPVEGSREAYKALKKGGVKVNYLEFPGCNHGSWNPAFSTPGLMDWLFAQKKLNK